MFHPDLGGEENILSFHTGLLDGTAHLFLIEVALRRINGTVSDFQCIQDTTLTFLLDLTFTLFFSIVISVGSYYRSIAFLTITKIFRITKENNHVLHERNLRTYESIPERQKILAHKKETLLQSMSDLQKAIDYIDWKQGFYEDVLSGKTRYYSNLINSKTYLGKEQ